VDNSPAITLNLPELSVRINNLARKSASEEQPGTTPVSEIIYALIFHYELLRGAARRNAVAMGGTMLSKTTGGVNYKMNELPMPLLQIINMLIVEISNNTCPFQQGNTQPTTSSSLLPTRGGK